jgi:hypothetical protein
VNNKGNKKLKSTGCCGFVVSAGHRRRRETEKRKKRFSIHQFLLPSSAAAREPTRRQWRRRLEQRAATIPAVLEGFLAPLWIFEGLFLIFKLFNLIFV